MKQSSRIARQPARGAAILSMGAGSLLALAAVQPPRADSVADYTKYHTHAELTAELQQLVRAHPGIARLTSIGRTRGGRDVWAVEIANTAGTPVGERPGLLIVGNLEGDQVIGSELALFTTEWLLTQYASNADVKQRIDDHVFYIVPRVNADGAEAMFNGVKRGQRRNLRPHDDDNDARVDEDPAEDLNGDGVITMMRVRDAEGPYMPHPSDARLLQRADASKGETGGWAVYWEGTDNDGDGFYNEDGEGGVDLNRNFQHAYPYYAVDAGPHMVSEPETRALLDYVIARRNIAAVFAFGGSDNLITSPDSRGAAGEATTLAMPAFADASNADARSVGVFALGGIGGRGGFGGGRGGRGGGGQPGSGGPQGQRPATTVHAGDLEYFRAIGESYREMTGLERAGIVRRPEGAFFEYAYYQFGVPSFSTPGWAPTVGTATRDSTARAVEATAGGGRGAGDANDIDLRMLRWLDAEGIDGFVAWTPFRHPQLGDVEIGGFRPYATSNPPAAHIAELGEKHATFVLHLSSLFSRVRIAETEVMDHGGGVFRIRAEIENTGFLPTALVQGVTARAVRPIMVQLGVAPEAILTGDDKTSFVNALAGSGTRRSFQWVIRGQPGARVELKLASQKSGNETVMLTLRNSGGDR